MPENNVDLTLTTKETYWINWRGINLGYFQPDTLSIAGQLLGDPLEVDQIQAEIARLEYRGIDPTIDVTMAQDSLNLVYETLLKDLAGFKAGTDGALYGWGDINENASLHAGLMEIIPTSNLSGSKLNSFAVWNAYLAADTAITLLKGKGRFGSLPLQFKAFANDDMPAKFRYLAHGNLNAEGGAPQGVFITANENVRNKPGLHLPAISIAAGGYDKLQAWLFYGQDGAVTAAINDVGNIDAVQTDITYNTLAGGAFTVGQIIKIENEYMRIEVDSGTVLTVTRGVNGSLRATHADTIAITEQTNVYYWPGKNLVDWLSSAPATVFAGDIVGASDQTEKGRVTNISDDDATANITATLQAKASEATVITAAA